MTSYHMSHMAQTDLFVPIKKFKNMSHRYDVTYLHLYEATQKTQNQHHLKL